MVLGRVELKLLAIKVQENEDSQIHKLTNA